MQIPEEHTAVFHPSSNRYQLPLGCDRSALVALTCGCMIVWISYGLFLGAVIALPMFFGLRILLQRMAKKDPYMVPLFFRSRRYQRFFPALARIALRQKGRRP